MALLRPRSLTRLLIFAFLAYLARITYVFLNPSTPTVGNHHEIKKHGVFERDRTLNVQKHPWLQSRMGRDERGDIFSDMVKGGVDDYWGNYQLP